MKNRKEFPVKNLCKVMGISKAGFYEWAGRKEPDRTGANKLLLGEIIQIFNKSDETYGSPRIAYELKENGVACSKSRVARVMQKTGLKAVAGRKYKPQTTDSKHSEPIAENIVNQDFSSTSVGAKVGCDITYIPTKEGFVYLAVVIDFYSRKVLGHALSDSLETPLICHALMKAVATHALPSELLHHSDRGSQYASFRYRSLLKSLGIRQSMSRAGNCYDNSMVESFFHSLKVERVHRRFYHSKAIAKIDVDDYIKNWYNSSRRHSSIGMLCPNDFINNQKKVA